MSPRRAPATITGAIGPTRCACALSGFARAPDGQRKYAPRASTSGAINHTRRVREAVAFGSLDTTGSLSRRQTEQSFHVWKSRKRGAALIVAVLDADRGQQSSRVAERARGGRKRHNPSLESD